MKAKSVKLSSPFFHTRDFSSVKSQQARVCITVSPIQRKIQILSFVKSKSEKYVSVALSRCKTIRCRWSLNLRMDKHATEVIRDNFKILIGTYSIAILKRSMCWTNKLNTLSLILYHAVNTRNLTTNIWSIDYKQVRKWIWLWHTMYMTFKVHEFYTSQTLPYKSWEFLRLWINFLSSFACRPVLWSFSLKTTRQKESLSLSALSTRVDKPWLSKRSEANKYYFRLTSLSFR